MMISFQQHKDLLQRNAYMRRRPFHHFKVNCRQHYAPTNVFSQTHPHGYRFQDFHYFIVIDFEATCDKDRVPNPQEIIEFPSVIVNSRTGEIISCFQTYVRPTCNHLLTDFCKDLTGIQQNQVDGGISLSEALLRHDQWLEYTGVKKTNFAVVTWTDWDCQMMLESECRYKKIAKPHYFNQWINLKVPFREVFGGKRFNLKEAVEKAGLSLEGRAHCGLDDAKNTARLLCCLMQKGFKFSITSSLPYKSNNDAFTSNQIQESPIPFSQHLQMPRKLQALQLQYHRHCRCGVLCGVGIIMKQGTKQHKIFFGCGNWNAVSGPFCRHFEWAPANYPIKTVASCVIPPTIRR